MLLNVNTDKASALDGLSDSLFKIGTDNQCKKKGYYCKKCIKKINLITSFLD